MTCLLKFTRSCSVKSKIFSWTGATTAMEMDISGWYLKIYDKDDKDPNAGMEGSGSIIQEDPKSGPTRSHQVLPGPQAPAPFTVSPELDGPLQHQLPHPSPRCCRCHHPANGTRNRRHTRHCQALPGTAHLLQTQDLTGDQLPLGLRVDVSCVV